MCSSASENSAQYFCSSHIQHVVSSKYFTCFFLLFIIYIGYTFILGAVQQLSGFEGKYNHSNHVYQFIFS